MRHRLRTFLVMAIVLGSGGPATAQSLRDTLAGASNSVGIQSGTAFDALADAIANTAANNIPVISASAGFTYRYNPELEVFERSAETLGPIFLERPETLGQGKFNVNVSYQFVKFNSYDGTDLDDLEGPGPVVLRTVDAGGNVQGFEADRLKYSLDLRNHVTAFSFTYGVLNDLDVNLLLPVIHTALDWQVDRQQVQTAGPDGVFAPDTGPQITGSSSDSKTGAGDLLLRLKYQLPRFEWFRSALGLQFRFPTGDEDDFQGTGDFWITPAFYASTLLWDRVEPFVNAAVDFNTNDSLLTQARYGAGFDVDIIPQVGFVVAFLGRSQMSDPVEPGETDFLYLLPSGQTARRPLLGIDLGRKDFYDLSFGMRAVVWRSVMLFANAIYALNDDGLRDDNFIPTFGIEATF